MFDQKLKDMESTIFIESSLFDIVTGSNVGVSMDIVFKGWHRYTYDEAVIVIRDIDHVLKSCPKCLQKRVASLKRQFIDSFGPDMEEV